MGVMAFRVRTAAAADCCSATAATAASGWQDRPVETVAAQVFSATAAVVVQPARAMTSPPAVPGATAVAAASFPATAAAAVGAPRASANMRMSLAVTAAPVATVESVPHPIPPCIGRATPSADRRSQSLGDNDEQLMTHPTRDSVIRHGFPGAQ